MEVDEATLMQKYDLVKLAVISSTQISRRTGTIISKLGSPSSDGKQIVVALTAKARCASKLVSIVEIAKRELKAGGTNVFQYNALRSEMIQVARESSKLAADTEIEKQGREDESDDAFETIGARSLADNKVRAVPVITIYVSAASVRELKIAYGEQR